MDAKVTLSFDEEVIRKAKEFAQTQNISLSRLCEFLLRKATSPGYSSLDELPVSDWVRMVAEEPAAYKLKPQSRKQLKDEYYAKNKCRSFWMPMC